MPENNTGLRYLLERKISLHVTDSACDPRYAAGEPLRTAAVALGGVSSIIWSRFSKKGDLIGFFSIYREEPGGFAEHQIALVRAFADQAVIAIENARLLGELRQRTCDLQESLNTRLRPATC